MEDLCEYVTMIEVLHFFIWWFQVHILLWVGQRWGRRGHTVGITDHARGKGGSNIEARVGGLEPPTPAQSMKPSDTLLKF